MQLVADYEDRAQAVLANDVEEQRVVKQSPKYTDAEFGQEHQPCKAAMASPIPMSKDEPVEFSFAAPSSDLFATTITTGAMIHVQRPGYYCSNSEELEVRTRGIAIAAASRNERAFALRSRQSEKLPKEAGVVVALCRKRSISKVD